MKQRIYLITAALLLLFSIPAAFASGAGEISAVPENYLLPLYAGEKIHVGPGYDFAVGQTLSEDGTFTIVAHVWDGAGNLWGKLKSGAGWVFLRSESAMIGSPVSASFADEALISKGPYEYVPVDKTPDAAEIAIYAHEPLTNVCFFELVLDDNGCRHKPLHTLPALTIEKPILAAVAFYGDMTTYGISFTDASGVQRCYELYLSGMDGSLVLSECAAAHHQ